MPTNFDPNLYTTAPQVSLSTGITLARSLHKLVPKTAPPALKKSAKKLVTVADAAQAALAARQRELGAVSEEDARVIDQEADASWTALRDRIAAYAALPAARFPKAIRAGELLTILFGGAGL